MAQAKQGQGREAILTFRKLVALQPTSSDAHVNLGIALADQYDLQRALGEFSEAIRLNPQFASGHYNKARVFYDLGKRTEAQAEAETAYKLSTDYPPLLYLLGLVEREANNLPLSTEAFEKLVSLEPHNAVARFLLGQNLHHMGNQEGAIEQWKAAVQDDPNNMEATYNLAKALGNAKKPEADVYMARFQELQRQEQLSDQVQTLNNFALEAARDHNWPQAVGQLKDAIEACTAHCPQLPVLHKNLGLIYARTGDVEQAEQELRIALKLKPDDPDTVKAIGILEGLRDKKGGSN
jgi:tetratricopeptide (TPR) repeat protein